MNLLLLRLKAGTLPWLLCHEVRLWWRGLRGKWFLIAIALFLGLSILTPLILGGLIFDTTDNVAQAFTLNPLPEPLLWGAVFIYLSIFFLVFTQAMGQSLNALFDRGDLDVLGSSPISSQVIFASRLLSVALNLFLSVSLFILLPTLAAVFIGFVQVLGIYLALAGIVIIATSLAMLMALLLVRLIGARQARIWIQILASVFWVCFFLMTQLPNWLISREFEAQPFSPSWVSLFATGRLLSAQSWIWFPARAIFLDPVAVMLTVLVSGLLFWLTVETLHHTFISGTQQSLTLKHRQSHTSSKRAFSHSFRQIALLKEWRIIGRNPQLLSQIFLPIVGLIPLTVLMLRGDAGDASSSLSTVVTTSSPLFGSFLTTQLTLICLAGEEAADLLRSSPVPGTALRRFKLMAVLIPVWLLASPLFVILLFRGEPWLPALAVFVGATICSAFLGLWNAQPISMTGLIKRQRQNASKDILLASLQFISFFVWMFLGFQISHGNLIPIVSSVGLIAILMLIAYQRSRILGSSLGF